MNRTALFTCATLCGITATVAAMAAMAAAQPELDPLQLSPQLYTARFKNDFVRVYEYSIKPGVKDPMHALSVELKPCPAPGPAH